jgi:type IV pilus assembly protein PilW
VTETAHFVFDVLGRDIENAGFYPSIRVGAGTTAVVAADVSIQEYNNPVSVSPPVAFNASVFGCKSQRFLPASNACGAHSGSVDADTLIVNYYSNDASGLDIGNRADCLRQDAANDATLNSTRRNAGHSTTSTANKPFLVPISPLFVSNRYSLGSTTDIQIEDAGVSTFSLTCNGNGVSAASNNYYPLIAGVDQLRFYYLERAGGTADSQFQRADAVTSWANVVAVRVCLMSRSMQAARLQGGTSYTLADCDGTDQSYTDGIERRIFSQTFALKNQSQLLNP